MPDQAIFLGKVTGSLSFALGDNHPEHAHSPGKSQPDDLTTGGLLTYSAPNGLRALVLS